MQACPRWHPGILRAYAREFQYLVARYGRLRVGTGPSFISSQWNKIRPSCCSNQLYPSPVSSLVTLSQYFASLLHMFPNLLPNTLQYLLTSFLWSKDSSSYKPPAPLRFELRHQHAVSDSSRIIFSDVRPGSFAFRPEEYGVGTKPTTVHRPTSRDLFSSARWNGLISVPWDEIEVEGPDIHDRETLLTLAKMTNNAYTVPENSDWYDLGPGWVNEVHTSSHL